MRDFETAHSLSKSHHRIFIARSDPLQSGRDHRPGIPEVRLAIQPMDRIVPAWSRAHDLRRAVGL